MNEERNGGEQFSGKALGEGNDWPTGSEAFFRLGRMCAVGTLP